MGGGAGIVTLYFASACTSALEFMRVSHVSTKEQHDDRVNPIF